MKPVISTVTIDRPRREVFDHLDVLANHEAFTDHFLRDWQLSGPERGVGGKLRARVSALGRTEDVELEVVEVQAPSLIAEVTLAAGGKRRTRGTYRLRDAGPARTHVTFELAFEAQPAMERLAAPLGRRWVAKMNDRAMARLKEQLEGAPAAAAA
jgi:hypothetical protein